MISNSLKHRIDKHDIISFDVYDTLISRNVKKPSDVFCLVENIYNKKFGPNHSITGFREKRIEAYKNAYSCYGSDCTLDRIYERLIDFSDAEKRELIKTEIDIELNICCVNSATFEIYQYALSKKKKIIIVSDMYLSTEVISSILKKCGITVYEKLYVSCDYGASKIKGDLFDIIQKDNNASPHILLHIGDGVKNDIIRAKQKGLDTYWIREKQSVDYDNNKGMNTTEKFQYSIQQSFIKNHIKDRRDEVEKLGFEVFGPLVYGFSKWLHEEFNRQSIDKVFFLAREGALFKSVYEMLYPNDNRVLKYLYVSRKSLVSPTFWIKPNYDDVINSIAKSKSVKVKNIIKRWGLDPKTCFNEIRAVGLSESEEIDGRFLRDNEKIKNLYDLIKERVIEESKKQYSLLRKYLEQESFGGKCAIIDIGWNGAMQNAFTKIASVWPIPTEVHGFYIGINTANLGVRLSNVNGYVYEQKNHEENRYAIYSFAGPFELSLTALHNTTIGYELLNGKCFPIFGRGEYINENGTFTKELNYTETVQKGIKDYSKRIKEEGLDPYIDMSSQVAFRNCCLFGLTPKTKHIKSFDGFSAYDLGEEQHFASTKYRHIFGNRNFINGFWKSTWKSGYLKMLFRLPLPYYKIYIKMRKRVN